MPGRRPTEAALLILFASLACGRRWADSGHPYELLSLCHWALLLAALGRALDRPALVGASIVAVAPAHLAWSLDTALMLLLHGSFGSVGPLGVADYHPTVGSLTTTEPSLFWEILATSHHIWFLPCSLGLLRREGVSLGRWRHLVGGAFLVCALQGVAIVLVPRCAYAELRGGERICQELNVNMCRGFWGFKDIAVLHLFDRLGPLFFDKAWTVCFFFYTQAIGGLLGSATWVILSRLTEQIPAGR